MTFSEKLIRLRKREGLSQEELAQYLDVSRQAVSRWEQGTAMPDAGNLLKLKQRFHVTADWLLEDAQGWEALTGSEENIGTGARSAAETAVYTPAPQMRKSVLPWAIPLGVSGFGLLLFGIFSSVFPCEYSIGAVAQAHSVRCARRRPIPAWRDFWPATIWIGCLCCVLLFSAAVWRRDCGRRV